MSSTIPGGFYIGTNGIPHDAHGQPITRKIVRVNRAELQRLTLVDDVIYAPADDGKPLTKKAKAALGIAEE